MASDEAAGHERTEQPSSRRREEARREGRIAISPDLTAASVLLGALGVHVMAGGRFITDAVATFQHRLATLGRAELTPDGAVALLLDAGLSVLGLAWPFVLGPAVAAVAALLLQTRFSFSLEALAPRWHRINPLQGLGRLFGTRGLVDLVRSALKLALVGGIAFTTLRADWPMLVGVGQGGGEATLATLGAVMADLWLRVGGAYLFLAGLDYGYQWWQHEKSLRMTREEARQESKETEGNPLLRGRLRTLHRQMAMRRMMTDVKRATVVLRNPTHVAVALRYDGGRMRAPKVIAKGERLVALRIIEVAEGTGVPVIENRPLARSLFDAVAIGKDIPAELYRAVAEVLAYVYSLKGGGR